MSDMALEISSFVIEFIFEGVPAPTPGGNPPWDSISGKPETFPPSTHNHALNDLSEKSYNSLTDKPTLTGNATETITVSTQAVAGKTYSIDPTDEGIDLTLPPTPTDGMEVGIIALNLLNPITVLRNGNSIEGSVALDVDLVGAAFTLKYFSILDTWKITEK